MKVQLQKSIALEDVPHEMCKALEDALQSANLSYTQLKNTYIALDDSEYTFALANLQYALNKNQEVFEHIQTLQHMLISYVEIINNGNSANIQETASE